MRRFFVHQKIELGVLQLTGDESKHATRVLRLSEGDEVLLTNGEGVLGRAVIRNTGKAETEVEVLEVIAREADGYRLVLIQSLLKGPRMDLLVEKITELGVHEIWPVTSERSVSKSERVDRWQRIAESAVKQSGNPLLPVIQTPLSLVEAAQSAAQSEGALKIFFSPTAETPLSALFAAKGSATVFLAIGPEGGFSAEEERLLAAAGFQAALLSKHVLRGETAALAAACLTRHLLDFPSRP